MLWAWSLCWGTDPGVFSVTPDTPQINVSTKKSDQDHWWRHDIVTPLQISGSAPERCVKIDSDLANGINAWAKCRDICVSSRTKCSCTKFYLFSAQSTFQVLPCDFDAYFFASMILAPNPLFIYFFVSPDEEGSQTERRQLLYILGIPPCWRVGIPRGLTWLSGAPRRRTVWKNGNTINNKQTNI